MAILQTEIEEKDKGQYGEVLTVCGYLFSTHHFPRSSYGREHGAGLLDDATIGSIRYLP